MGDGQEVPQEFPRKMNQLIENFQAEKEKLIKERYNKFSFLPIKEQHTTIVSTLCWGCGAMIEDVIEGEDNWLFCHAGQEL